MLPANSDEIEVTIRVTDVNEGPPAVTGGAAAVTYMEVGGTYFVVRPSG